MLRPRCRRAPAGRVVRAARWAWSPLAEGIRWRQEFVLILRTPELAIAWIVCLDALPALSSHATAIDPLRNLVLGRRLLNALATVGLELADATSSRLPVMLAAADEERGKEQGECD